MDIRQMLVEYEDAKRLEEETREDLRLMKEMLSGASVDIVKGSNPNYPYEPRTFKVEGVMYGEYRRPHEIIEIENILKRRVENAKKTRLRVEYWLNTIPPRMARIVRAHYLQGLSWGDTALRMGIFSGDAIRMEFNRFLEKAAKVTGDDEPEMDVTVQGDYGPETDVMLQGDDAPETTDNVRSGE